MSSDVSIIKNLVSFNPDTQFLTTSLTVEDKVKGWVFKYSFLQTIKKFLGYYNPEIIGNQLVKISETLNNPEIDIDYLRIFQIVRRILILNNKLISSDKNGKRTSFIHGHFQHFLTEMVENRSDLGIRVTSKGKPALFEIRYH